MFKWVLRSKLAVMGIAAAAAVTAVGVPALAANFGAIQEGFQQGGNADSATVKMRVEASLPADAELYPDQFQQYNYQNNTQVNCAPANFGGGGTNPLSYPGCEGAPVSLTVTNESSHPLRITSVAQTTVQYPANTLASIASDRQVNGQWVAGMYGDPPGTAAGTGSVCGTFAYFVAPNIQQNYNLQQKALPLIPAHATLTIPTAGGSNLGYIHLQTATPMNCMGASYQVPLTLTAVPSNF